VCEARHDLPLTHSDPLTVVSDRLPVLDELLAALRRRGAPEREIQHFRRHALTLPVEAALPCPLCYVNNRNGVLSVIADEAGFERVRCGRCGEHLNVRKNS